MGKSKTDQLTGPRIGVSVAGSGGRANDEVSQKPIFIIYEHHEVHEGNTFEASQKTADDSPLGDNNSYDMLLVTGNQADAHLTFEGACGGDADLFLYENTVVTDNGTKLKVQNMRRSLHGVNINTVQAYETPTITNVGDELSVRFMPGGAGPQSVGGTGRTGTEWMLKSETYYLIRVTNRGGQGQPASIFAQWYEKIAED
jgi:hypothetical protein